MRNAQRTLPKAFATAVLLGAFSWTIAQESGSPRTVADTTVVKLPLIVTDRSNHSIDTVLRADIQLVEDGLPREIASLDVDERPVKYAIAMDTSLSFKSLLAPAAEAAALIINRNRIDDETMLVSFVSSDNIHTIQAFTSDKSKVMAGLKSLRLFGGQSAVIDAVYLAAQTTATYKDADLSSRRAVILVSDGEDRHSYYKLDALSKLLRENNVQVFALGIVAQLEQEGGYFERSSRERAEGLLKRIANETGGRVFFPKDVSELQQAAVEIAHDLHVQFVVEYQRPKPLTEGFHKVQIKIANSGREKRTAITRPGYFVKTAKPVQMEKEKTQ